MFVECLLIKYQVVLHLMGFSSEQHQSLHSHGVQSLSSLREDELFIHVSPCCIEENIYSVSTSREKPVNVVKKE